MSELKGFKFETTLVLEFKKIQNYDKTLYHTLYLNSKAETIINESDIDNVFKSICNSITSNIQKSLGQSSGWVLDSVIVHNIIIWEYNILTGSSYIKLPKELDHPRKGLVNIQNIDNNECFKWCLVRYLHPADCSPAKITKAGKVLARIDFKDIKFPVKIKDIHNIVKQNSINISVFGFENERKYPIYVLKKCCEEKHVDLLLIGEEGQKHYVLIKDFNTFMYDHTLHREKKLSPLFTSL